MTWWGMLRGRAAAEGGGRMTRTAKRAELPSQLAALQAELDTTAPEHKARRERLMWQIRRTQKRMVEVEARLAASVRHF